MIAVLLASTALTASAQTPAVPLAVIDAKFDAEGLSQFVAPVRIAGHTFWCSIDSGGSWVLALDSDKARGAGLRPNARGSGAGVGPDIVSDERIRGVTVDIGAVMLPDTTVVMRPQPSIVPDIDCVFGLGLLQDYVVEFDYDVPRLRVFDSRTFQRPANAVLVPFEIDRFRNPYVETHLALTPAGDISGTLILDTGASYYSAVLMKSFLDKNDVVNGVGRVIKEVSHTPGLELSAARVIAIRLGTVTISDPVVALVLTPSAGVIEDGLVGAGFFKRFAATFDYQRKQLWLVPNRHVAERQPFDTSGITFRYGANGDVVVDAVDSDSAGARADIRPGDRLLEIDGHNARDLTLADIKTLLSRPDLACALRLDRAGETLTTTLLLKRRL